MMLTQTFNNKLDKRKWSSVRHLSVTITPPSHFLPLFGLLVSSSLPVRLCAGGPICVQALSVHGSGILPEMILLWRHEARQSGWGWGGGDLIKKRNHLLSTINLAPFELGHREKTNGRERPVSKVSPCFVWAVN